MYYNDKTMKVYVMSNEEFTKSKDSIRKQIDKYIFIYSKNKAISEVFL